MVADGSACRRATSARLPWSPTSAACGKSQPCAIASSNALRVSAIRSSAAPPSAMIAGCRSSANAVGAAASPAAPAAASAKRRRVGALRGRLGKTGTSGCRLGLAAQIDPPVVGLAPVGVGHHAAGFADQQDAGRQVPVRRGRAPGSPRSARSGDPEAKVEPRRSRSGAPRPPAGRSGAAPSGTWPLLAVAHERDAGGDQRLVLAHAGRRPAGHGLSFGGRRCRPRARPQEHVVPRLEL